MAVTQGSPAASWSGGSPSEPAVDPLAGYAVPTDAEIGRARAVRGRIVVADLRDQFYERLALLVPSAWLLVVIGLSVSWFRDLGGVGPSVVPLALSLTTVMGMGANWTVQSLLARRLKARSTHRRAVLFGPRLPEGVPEHAILRSSPGLAILAVVESSRGIGVERLSQVLGIPVDLAGGWAYDVALRGLVRELRNQGTTLYTLTPLGRQQLDRVLGAQP